MVNYVTKKRETKHERGGLCLDEDEAHYYFVQLLSAVEYCHRNHVAHRSAMSNASQCCLQLTDGACVYHLGAWPFVTFLGSNCVPGLAPCLSHG